VAATLVVSHRKGFFARTGDEWAAQLLRLAGDPVLARRLGHRGRALVEDHYEAAAVGSRLADLLTGTVARARAG